MKMDHYLSRSVAVTVFLQSSIFEVLLVTLSFKEEISNAMGDNFLAGVHLLK